MQGGWVLTDEESRISPRVMAWDEDEEEEGDWDEEEMDWEEEEGEEDLDEDWDEEEDEDWEEWDEEFEEEEDEDFFNRKKPGRTEWD